MAFSTESEEYVIFHRLTDSVNKSNFNLSLETTFFFFIISAHKTKKCTNRAFGEVLEHTQLRCSFLAVDLVTNTI